MLGACVFRAAIPRRAQNRHVAYLEVMANSKAVRTFVCLLILAVFALPVGLAPLASEASSGEISGETSGESSESGERSACEMLDQTGETGEERVENAGAGPLCHGVLTCTFYVAGQVIALPFRLLGGVFEFII
ncbi:MAG: hypothetical protein JRE71_15625 [Deltaproteobacteria bacterium]|nr:hypothetical protein [Deltaproteobacteria bacterium]